VDHVSYLSYDRHGRVQAAAAASVLDQNLIESTTEIFVKRFYERDPNYPLMCTSTSTTTDTRGGPLHLRRQARVAVAVDVARQHRRPRIPPAAVRPAGFSSKVSLLRRWRDQTCYLNLYFSRTKVQRDRTARLMRSHASTLMALAHRHDELVSLHRQPEAGLWPELSQRERETARLLVEGCTAKENRAAAVFVAGHRHHLQGARLRQAGVQNLREFLTLARH
jgi:hypothetical protein